MPGLALGRLKRGASREVVATMPKHALFPFAEIISPASGMTGDPELPRLADH